MKNLNMIRSQLYAGGQKVFKIAILEDSELFNDILTRQIEYFTRTLAMERNFTFEIRTYTSPSDFVRNLKNDTDIAFVDYYLGDGVTATEIIHKIRERCWDCKVVIVSQVRNIKTISIPLMDETIDFIYKDGRALSRCCFILEDLVNSGLTQHELN